MLVKSSVMSSMMSTAKVVELLTLQLVFLCQLLLLELMGSNSSYDRKVFILDFLLSQFALVHNVKDYHALSESGLSVLPSQCRPALS